MSRDDANLLDILKAARQAIEFSGPADREAFLSDTKPGLPCCTSSWCIARVPGSASGSEVEMIAGTRDRLIHFHDGVDIQVGKLVPLERLDKYIHSCIIRK